MAVTCPYCNGIYSVRRLNRGSPFDVIPDLIDGEKVAKSVPRYDSFYCSDCGKEFSSDGKTMIEQIGSGALIQMD